MIITPKGNKMTIHEAPTTIHWNYFLALEEDVANLARFIELTTANFECYSTELSKMLFAAASEIDVVAKQYCTSINPQRRAQNITHYKDIITKQHPYFHSVKVYMPRFGLTLEPWIIWGGAHQPLWWRAYNNVKHERHEHFSDGNLKNALNAIAALYVLLVFFYREEAKMGKLSPNPRLFIIGEPFTIDRLFWDHEHTLVYNFDNFDEN